MQSELKLITPLSHGLPKTGQTIAYSSYDDGFYEDGWFFNKDNAGNRVRFIEKEIVSGEHIIMDLATRLMWPKSGLSVACNNGAKLNWDGSLIYILSLVYSGFNNWRLPNMQELLSICNWSISNPTIWSAFTNVQTDNYSGYWTGTTYKFNTNNAWIIRFNGGYGYGLSKSTTTYIRPVRRFA